MKGDPQAQDAEDSLSRLYKAHTTLAHIMLQVDGLVLKAHKMNAHRQINGLDLCGFSQFLESTASSLQEWIPRLEDATGKVSMQGQRHEQLDPSTSFQGEQKGGDGEMAASPETRMQSKDLLDVPAVSGDDMGLMDKDSTLSDSPLVPWLERVQFFILTPMADRKRRSSPILLRRCSFKDQETLQSSSPSAISSARKSCTQAPALEAVLAPPLLSFQPSFKEERVADHHLHSEPSMPSPVHQQSFESPHMLPDALVTPLPPKSLVKRYSHFFEAEELFTDSLPVFSVTPLVKQRQASHHKSAEEDEVECMEITEYFTAFSQPRSIAHSVSTSERNSFSLPLDACTPHIGREELPSNMEDRTPLPPQSLMKRYAQFLHSEESNEMAMDTMMTLTPMLLKSPPKTCILMRPHHKEDSAKPKHNLQTPLLLLKSPFKTPGLFLKTAHDDECDEDMDLASLKKPCQPPRPPQSVRRTPSSDMQFTTVRRRAPASIKRSPFVDLQFSTVKKPGVPLPGEQTLKRELWCRMEAEFTSIANVCKSLFTESQTDASADAGAGKSGMENKENLFVPRGLRQRGSNMYI